MSIPLTSQRSMLAGYLRPLRARVALLSVLLLGSIALELLNPQILRGFIDRATGDGTQAQLIRAGLLFIGVALLQQLVVVAATYMSHSVGWSATNALRGDLLAHCLGLDMSFHKARTPGELIERVDGDVTALATFFSQFVILVLGNALLLLGVIALLFREDWRVGLAIALYTIVAIIVLDRSGSHVAPYMTAERAASAELFGFLEERLAGIDDIRANGAGPHAMRGFARVGAVLFQASRRAGIRGAGMWSISMALFVLGYTLALGMGAYLYQAGAITLGTVYLFFQYTDLLRRPLEQIADQLREFQRARAGIERIGELARLAPTMHSGSGAHIPVGPLQVEFAGVSFAYDDEGVGGKELGVRDASAPDPQPLTPNSVLENVSFTLAPGRVLGLLGRTGSGKTTVTRLLFRLYDPTAGNIRLGGADLRALDLDELRRRVGIVTQDVQLFQASVRDNLTLFDRSIADAHVLAALSELGLGPWLAGLPAGLDSELAAGGGGLSAGEAQLLAFARVFLRDPGLVILDEASSRLDPATEQLIERAVERLLRGRSGIIIAHRLKTVQRADEILILERGQVAEHGARAALAADHNSRFATLLRVGLAEVLV